MRGLTKELKLLDILRLRKRGVRFSTYIRLVDVRLPEGAHVVDYGEQGVRRDKIKRYRRWVGSLTEDIQGVGGGWVAQDERAEGWL